MAKSTLIAAACMIVAIACGSSEPGSEATTNQNATTGCGAASAASSASTAAARSISFATDVLPIFTASCAFGSCHGSPKDDNGVFLGLKGSANDASAIRAGLVARPSVQSPSMPYVTPSDPSKSYLFRKLTADFCGLPECDGDRCGQPMPRGGDPLDAAALETVRTWILQGASDS